MKMSSWLSGRATLTIARYSRDPAKQRLWRGVIRRRNQQEALAASFTGSTQNVE